MNEDLRLHGLIGGVGGSIKSVQAGNNYITGYSVTNDVSINPVDLNSSLVEINFSPAAYVQAISAAKLMASAKLLKSDQLRLERCSGRSGDPYPYIAWTVTEFNNVKSKQSGSSIFETNSDVTSFNIAINPVNLQKYRLVASFRTSRGSYQPPVYLPRYYMTNDSTITVRWFSDTSDYEFLYIEWQVIEFK